MMFAGQSYFLDGDLILAYGIREDDFYLFSPNGNGIVNTFDGERVIIDRDNVLIQEFSGQTETYGAVYHITNRFSLAYNTSTNNGISDFSDKDIFGGPGEQGGINPVPSGKSEDFSVTADLLNGGLFLKATDFETSSNSISSFPSWVDGNAMGAINSLYDDPAPDGGFNVFRYTLPQRRDIRLRASFRF